MDNKLTWVKGMSSPNPAGRKKGSKRNWKRELERFVARNGSSKELERLYDHLESETEQAEMLKWIYAYIVPKPRADSMSADEIQALYEQRVSLEQKNHQLQQELKQLRNDVSERIG
jgi:hypothetical protein